MPYQQGIGDLREIGIQNHHDRETRRAEIPEVDEKSSVGIWHPRADRRTARIRRIRRTGRTRPLLVVVVRAAPHRIAWSLQQKHAPHTHQNPNGEERIWGERE